MNQDDQEHGFHVTAKQMSTPARTPARRALPVLQQLRLYNWAGSIDIHYLRLERGLILKTLVTTVSVDTIDILRFRADKNTSDHVTEILKRRLRELRVGDCHSLNGVDIIDLISSMA